MRGWWGQNERDRKRQLISLREQEADGKGSEWKRRKKRQMIWMWWQGGLKQKCLNLVSLLIRQGSYGYSHSPEMHPQTVLTSLPFLDFFGVLVSDPPAEWLRGECVHNNRDQNKTQKITQKWGKEGNNNNKKTNKQVIDCWYWFYCKQHWLFLCP